LPIRALPITVLCFLILGIVYLIGSLNLGIGSAISPGAGLYPFFIGITLISLALPLFLLSIKQKEPQQSQEEGFPKGKDLKRVVALALTFVFFAIFLKPLGYWVCGTALMGASLKLLGMQSWGKIVSISVLTTAISYFLFVSLLQVPIPLGIFFS
jgi:putative tricarboxylic transport membrane protein